MGVGIVRPLTLSMKILHLSDVYFLPGPALGIDEAFGEITRNRGILYDPDVVDASISLLTRREYQFH